MKKLQAFKFEIQPNGEQRRKMLKFVGSSRFVFNKALAWQKERYAQDNAFRFSYETLANLLPEWKKDPAMLWLKECPSQALQQSLKNLESSFRNFFAKRADFPKFKKKGMGDSFRFPQGFKLDQRNSRLFLPKLGWVRYRNSREILGVAKNITVSFKSGKWYAAIQTEQEQEMCAHPATSMVGIDVGIVRFATLSDGIYIEPLSSFKKHQKSLAKYQRRMSRKVKFSQNWKKAKAKVTRLHMKIANARSDFLHKTSTEISKNHAIICVEDVRIGNMSKSAKGNSELHGKKVKQKSGLNRLILDQGWGEFRRQLEYKQAWRGGEVIAVSSRNTSRTCPCCGHASKDNRKTQSQFECVACGYKNHADVVGALNIVERGHRLLACGESVQLDRSLKQEPTEVSHVAFAA